MSQLSPQIRFIIVVVAVVTAVVVAAVPAKIYFTTLVFVGL